MSLLVQISRLPGTHLYRQHGMRTLRDASTHVQWESQTKSFNPELNSLSTWQHAFWRHFNTELVPNMIKTPSSGHACRYPDPWPELAPNLRGEFYRRLFASTLSRRVICKSRHRYESFIVSRENKAKWQTNRALLFI